MVSTYWKMMHAVNWDESPMPVWILAETIGAWLVIPAEQVLTSVMD